MSLFEQLVSEALKNQADLALLQPVVEKELLHHDILRELSEAKILPSLTFIGGTCLRACYGSVRLSEDLDFIGGKAFKAEQLQEVSLKLREGLERRYGLPVEIAEPKKTSGSISNVSTWKMSIQTRPQQKHLPKQRIHMDICAIPSYDRQPMMLRNLYGVDMGTSGLIVQAQSREEILADKLIAFAFRENRIKNRDLWDIQWLVQQGVVLPVDLIPAKISDHKCSEKHYREKISSRLEELEKPELQQAFMEEMKRFLPRSVLETVTSEDTADDFWDYLKNQIRSQAKLTLSALG